MSACVYRCDYMNSTYFFHFVQTILHYTFWNIHRLVSIRLNLESCIFHDAMPMGVYVYLSTTQFSFHIPVFWRINIPLLPCFTTMDDGGIFLDLFTYILYFAMPKMRDYCVYTAVHGSASVECVCATIWTSYTTQ